MFRKYMQRQHTSLTVSMETPKRCDSVAYGYFGSRATTLTATLTAFQAHGTFMPTSVESHLTTPEVDRVV